MQHDDRVYVGDMLDRGRSIARLIAGLDYEGFVEDEPVRVAVAHYIQDMGEAASHLGGPFRGEHPDVPWSDIVAMRNRIAHGYREIDFDRVWDVASVEVPAFVELLAPLGPEGEWPAPARTS